VCCAKGSMETPSGLNDQNINASPFLGLYATLPFAHSDRVGSTCCASSGDAQWLASAGQFGHMQQLHIGASMGRLQVLVRNSTTR
jgi:hypothetical protein